MHEAITILQRLDPPRYPTIDGINTFEAILGKLSNSPCKDLDIGGGRVIIDSLLGIEGLCVVFTKERRPKDQEGVALSAM
jgi:hypothetical protein